MPPPQSPTFSANSWIVPRAAGGKGPGPKAAGLSLGTLPLPGPPLCGVPWGHASPPPTVLPFLQVVPCPEPTIISQTPGWQTCCSPCPNILFPLPLSLQDWLSQDFLSPPHAWTVSLCPCHHSTDHIAYLLFFLQPPPHPTRLHVCQGRDYVIFAFPGSGIGPGIQYVSNTYLLTWRESGVWEGFLSSKGVVSVSLGL